MTTVSKAQFGAVSRYAKLEIANAEACLTEDQPELDKMQTVLAKLGQYQARITALSDQLLVAIDDSEIEAEVDKHEKLKADMIDIIARLEINVASIGPARDDNSAVASQASGSRGHGYGPHASVKLPKLNIPPFDGDPLKFHEFWDAFESTIHNNEALSSVEKLNYLKSYLRGDAKNPIAGYALVAANYDTVIEILKQRFGNKELIIYNHLDSVISLPPTGTHVSDLQRTIDECERHIRSLVNLGLEEDTFGRVFVPIIMSKLPIGMRISLHKKQLPGHCWTLAELRQALQQEIYAREMGNRSFGANGRSQQTANRQNDVQRPRWRNQDARQKPATASTLTNTSKPNPPPWTRKCRFCDGEHYSTDCRKYPSSESRRKVLGDCCFNCLGRSHTAANCRSKRCCYYCKTGQHHSSLCNTQFGATVSSRKTTGKTNLLKVQTIARDEGESQKPDPQPKVTATVLSNGKRGILQTALANINGVSGTFKARILFDNGATNAFITTQAATRIGAKKVGREVIALAGFQDTKRKSTVCPVYEVGIKLLNGTTKKICAYGTAVITSAIERHPFDVTQNPLLSKVQLADPLTDKEEEAEIDLLLGSDYYYEFVKAERITLQNGIILLDSELGYIVAGRIEGKQPKTTQLLLTQSQFPDSNFELERLWKLEEVGITDPKESEEDESALKKFNDTVFCNEQENRYYVKWPLKVDAPDLPTNYKLAYGRLKSLLHKLRSNPLVLQRYNDTMREQKENNIIELAAPTTANKFVHYIPHHGVLTPQKTTTKLRIVFDASSKITKANPSLNECMHRGPVMLADLCGLMVRFRTKPIAIVSDVEKAFLQIGLQEPDRDLVRFLWVADPNKPVTQDNIRHYRFRRVCFGVIASPFLLAAVISHHLQRLNTPISKNIIDNIYVDNLVTGVNSAKEAAEYYQSAKEAFASASMNLREWFSNSEHFIAQIPASSRGEGITTKVLGMNWNTSRDQLSLTAAAIDCGSHGTITKRIILRSIAKLFDPCGYFAPVTISGKLLLQKLWQNKYAWDDPVSDDIATTYRSILNEWKKIPEFQIPRLVGKHAGLESAHLQLHCFCDASAKAYSAVLYLKIQTDSGGTRNLIFAKARVAPLKSLSVPRLELTAMYVGVKLSTFLETQLGVPVHRKLIWSDSQCALHWILGKPVATRFVKNRVDAIKEHRNLEFRYVPTHENPADLPTRGISFQGLATSTLWWKGPYWLAEDESQWPKLPNSFDDTTSKRETLRNDDDSTGFVTEAFCRTELDKPMHCLIDINKYSSLGKAVAVAGYITRFCNQLTKKSRANHLWLNAKERAEALILLIKESQARHMESLDKKAKSSTFGLGLHKDSQGVLRCSTRIENADLPESAKQPILLPHDDNLTRLVIQDHHARLHHAGLKHTLAELTAIPLLGSAR